MYKGFNLDFDEEYFIESIGYKDYATIYDTEVIETYKENINFSIEKIKKNIKEIDGTELQNSWFPNIESHIFLSHSHSDEEIVKRFAGYLYSELGIKVFIDSTIWRDSNEELIKLMNKYAKWEQYKIIPNGDIRVCYVEEVFKFKDNINMMLLMALTKMINNTDCFLFFNTNNSTINEYHNSKTYSPWIYYEIGISKCIEKIKRKNIIETFSSKHKSSTESIIMTFDLDTEHLINLSTKEIIEWVNICKNTNIKTYDALDNLYNINKNNLHNVFH